MNKLQQRILVGLGDFSIGLLFSSIFSGLVSSKSAGFIAPAIAQNSEIASTSSNNISIVQAIFLGLIQGLTEFLPISSTAHLKILPILLGWGDPGVAATAIIQLGSIAAVLWYFAADLRQILGGSIAAIRRQDYMSHDFRLAAGVALGSIPIIVCGLLLKIFVPDFDNSPLRSLSAIAIASIIMSLLLALSEKIGSHKRQFEKVTPMDGILMGFSQAMALIPGVSRSGSTMTAGLFMNLERAAAARYSFLLGIPAITLAGLVELKDVIAAGVNSSQLLPLGIGIISAAFFSYISIAWLLRYLQTKNNWVFVWYRLAFGILLLIGVSRGLK
jgi:undecaprenyl-diphosphatase